MLRSGWITTGEVTRDFEKMVKTLTKSSHALAVNSATSGLHLALEAVGVKSGDFVITTPYTFTSTAEVMRYLGAHPLFVDIEKDGFNIDVSKVKKAIGLFDKSMGKLSAIVPVHIGGKLCNREELGKISRMNNLSIIEDCAHLQPTQPLSNTQNILVYSFYATKCITTAEGGMIVTNNTELANRIKTMRFHGINREAWNRYKTSGSSSWEYDVVAPGYKYNLPDILSALGLVQLSKADSMLSKRREIARAYDKGFMDCSYLKIPPSNKNDTRHLYILQLVPNKISITRDEFVKKLNDKGVGISVHYKPLHTMKYYKQKYNLKNIDFPESYNRFLWSFSLPIYPDLTEEEISIIINAVKETGKQAYRS